MKNYSLRSQKVEEFVTLVRELPLSLLTIFLFIIPLVTIFVIKPPKISRAYLPATPPVTPPITLSPTPTLTPTPFPSCLLKMSQTLGTVKWGVNNNWQHYVEFVANTSGLVDKISVKAGNYGGAQRSIFCKVTRADGTNLSRTLSSLPFTSTSGAQWRNISFANNRFSLTKGQTYRLYCQGPDSWNSLYWLWESTLGGIKGKTYKIFLCL